MIFSTNLIFWTVVCVAKLRGKNTPSRGFFELTQNLSLSLSLSLSYRHCVEKYKLLGMGFCRSNCFSDSKKIPKSKAIRIYKLLQFF